VANWTPQDWVSFLTAAGVFVGVVLSALAAFMASLAKMKGDTNADKIDKGTAATVAHAKVAATTANIAAEEASKAADHVKHMETKLDANTDMTEQTKTAADTINAKSNVWQDEIIRIATVLEDHDIRIASLESQIATLRLAVESVNKNVDTTRHEFRGSLQTIMNKIDIMAMGSNSAKADKS
jgi:chromosome segregation ATPase